MLLIRVLSWYPWTQGTLELNSVITLCAAKLGFEKTSLPFQLRKGFIAMETRYKGPPATITQPTARSNFYKTNCSLIQNSDLEEIELAASTIRKYLKLSDLSRVGDRENNIVVDQGQFLCIWFKQTSMRNLLPPFQKSRNT